MGLSLNSLQLLASLGLTTEQMAGVVKVLTVELAPLEDRRSKDRNRKLRVRHTGSSAECPQTQVRGMSMEGDRNSHGMSADTPKNAVVIDNNTTPSEIGISKQQQRASRGTRLPKDFQPHPNILELARSLGFTDAKYWDHFERFCDYWWSLSGAKACKLDWNKTWRNRVKDLADHLRKNHGPHHTKPLAARFDAIRAAINGGSEQGDILGPEDSVSLPRLRQGA